MKLKTNRITWALLLTLLLLFAAGAGCMAESGGEDEDNSELHEWTVMVYLCGSDMESQDGLASYNLHEIMSAAQPENTYRMNPATHEFFMEKVAPDVNVVVETGGARKWHNDEEWGLAVAADRLQRYELSHTQDEKGHYPLMLVDEQPQASMADPGTLREFIRWSAANYPAQKYMLVIWGHGKGALGMIIDDCYDGDMMQLSELEEALQETYIHFEAVLLDACMMANLETAQIMAEYADWMIASEELVSGYGSAFRQWMHDLFQNPYMNGEMLGCRILDQTETKYAGMEDEHGSVQMTWSVLELKNVEQLTGTLERLAQFINDLYEFAPEYLPESIYSITDNTDWFGTGRKYMHDANYRLDSGETSDKIDRDILNALAVALDDVVLYSVNGTLHSNASGLSFCIPSALTPDEMDSYARVCRVAPYLALIDALRTDWTAPDWVYEKTRKLPELDHIAFLSQAPQLAEGDGLPVVRGTGKDILTWRARYEFFRLDEDSGEMLCLGNDKAVTVQADEAEDIWEYRMNEPQTWPSIDGSLCMVEYLKDYIPGQYSLDGMDVRLYDIPVLIGGQQMNFRLGAWHAEDAEPGSNSETRIYGISQGIEVATGAPNRSSIPLALMQGQEFTLLYPLLTSDRDVNTVYQPGDTKTLYRGMEVDIIPLPPGRYACNFILQNCFFQTYWTELVQVEWDGKAFHPAAD